MLPRLVHCLSFHQIDHAGSHCTLADALSPVALLLLVTAMLLAMAIRGFSLGCPVAPLTPCKVSLHLVLYLLGF